MKRKYSHNCAALLLTAALLISLFTGCGQTPEATETETADIRSTASDVGADELAEAEQSLFADWFETIKMQEHSLSTMIWVTDCAKKAVETRSWDDYKKANAVLSAGTSYIAEDANPVQNTTGNQYELLKDRYGMDVYIVQMDSGDDVRYHTNVLKDFQDDFKLRYFMKSSQSSIEEELSMRKSYYLGYIDYYATETAYILKLLSESSFAESLRSQVETSLPLISGAMPPDDLSKEELENLGSSSLDKIEAALERIEELQVVRDSDLELLQEAHENNDYSALIRDKIEMTGSGKCLSAPEWYYSNQSSIEWLLDDGADGRMPENFEEPTQAPSILKITCTDTDADALRQYIGQLEVEGYKTELLEDGNKLTLTLPQDDWNMTITWDGTTMTMVLNGQFPCLVPSWYM